MIEQVPTAKRVIWNPATVQTVVVVEVNVTGRPELAVGATSRAFGAASCHPGS